MSRRELGGVSVVMYLLSLQDSPGYTAFTIRRAETIGSAKYADTNDCHTIYVKASKRSW